jgi:CrcB protein
MLIGLGGFVGSTLRYLMAGWMHQLFKTDAFPIGTTLVNITGCLAIGLLGGWSEQIQAFSPNARLFLLIGLLGSYTTFSTFGYETIALLRDRELTLAFINVAIQLTLGFGAVAVGFNLSAKI